MLVPFLVLAACHKNEDDAVAPPASPLLDVAESASWPLPGLHGPAYVVRADHGIPYVYAEDREDLARVTGFVVARDRFFMVDMIRRLALGRVSEILGDAALSSDQESRGIGMTRVADRYLAQFDANPEWGRVMDAYAEGVNAYIEQVNAGALPAPSEYATLAPALGFLDPAELLAPFDRRDMAAVGATLTYNLGFETTDVGRAAAFDTLPGLFAGAPLGAARQAGVLDDIWNRVEPVFPVSSAPGWGTSGLRRAGGAASGAARRTSVPKEMTDRLKARLDRIEARFGHDRDSGFGSNTWAVAGSATTDGRSLLAGDGHLALSVPALFYAIGMDTAHLGGGDMHQVGLALPGFPTLAVGTNGNVAWSQTQLFGDITDWYREELDLDANGVPTASRFQGASKPLVRVDETYDIAEVVLLGSTARTETWSRWETFDGRLLAEIEGREGEPGPGETLVNVQGVNVVPSDIDGDGVITAVSFDYTAFDEGDLTVASDAFGQAEDVYAFREATRKLVAYSQNIIASDKNGDILYTGYQAVPCRGYLPRDPDGSFADGADPMMLIDGTQFGGFTIPVDADANVDETQGDDPYRCVVPFEEYPQSISPPEGYVLTANNDIGNISTDGDLWNDPWYVGGPWLEGYRGQRIEELLKAEVAAGTADIAAMSRIQGDHHSTVADQWSSTLLESIAAGRAADPASTDPVEVRLAASFARNAERFGEVETRLRAWQESGLTAKSGVETFYQTVTPEDREHAVATMLWNAWNGEFVRQVFDDEGFPGVWYPTGDTGKTRTLTRMLAGRGPGNPEGMASWVPETQESAFFDVLSTPEVETSTELMLISLETALDRLSAPSSGPGLGGFGTTDMSQWLWGERHLVKFESLLAELLTAEDSFGFLIAPFSITPDVLPIADDLAPGDPRASLPWFPRDGDHLNVDAGNPGFAADEWMYSSGPVFRMVIALGPDGAEGVNVLPGGESGLTDSPYYADMAALWLANDTWPMRTSVEQVIAAAAGRETFTP